MKFKFPLLSGVLVLVVAAGWLGMTIPHCAHTDISPPTIPSTVPLQNPQDSPAPPAANAATAAPQISNPSPNVPEVLIAGGLELPVVFTDGISDAELRQFIIKDINLVYGHLTDHESLLPIYKNRLRIEGRDVSPIAQINFVGIGRYFPKELNALMGIIVDLGGRKMVVPPELANIYAASEIRLKKTPASIQPDGSVYWAAQSFKRRGGFAKRFILPPPVGQGVCSCATGNEPRANCGGVWELQVSTTQRYRN